MKASELLAAVSGEATLAKSKAYAQRALRAKEAGDLDEYQLWASLALELLGKACLARIHPSLIVNPLDHISMFAASGVNLGTDIKTIASHTLFDRLRLITKGFDEKVKKFCDDISQRRNAELHSGEVPFKEMKLSAWEGAYWHAAQLVLVRMDSTLEEWLGASHAKAPKQIVAHARKATIDAAVVRIDRAREQFNQRRKRDREAALKEASTKSISHYERTLHLLADAHWRTKCPACGGSAIMGGMQFHEVVIENYPGRQEEEFGDEELVEKAYGSEEFFCPVCELRLDGQAEIEAADLETEHTETETRERRYEEEYNNE
jgi:hypothetical protein